MSIEAIAKASKITELPSTTKFVLIALSNFADDDGASWPKHSTLAAWCNMSRETVQRHMSKLEELGYVTSKARRYYDGRNASKVYQLDFLQSDFAPHGEPTVTENHTDRVTENHTDRVTESHNKNHQPRTINLEPPLPLTPRQAGTNPRAKGTNPREAGTNPRALDANPKSLEGAGQSGQESQVLKNHPDLWQLVRTIAVERGFPSSQQGAFERMVGSDVEKHGPKPVRAALEDTVLNLAAIKHPPKWYAVKLGDAVSGSRGGVPGKPGGSSVITAAALRAQLVADGTLPA